MGHYKKQSECGSYNYLLYLPDGYDEAAKERRDWPLLFFLHGADRKGVDLDALRSSGIARLCEERIQNEPPSSHSSSSSCDLTIFEMDEMPALSTCADVDLADADGDSPRTATANLNVRRAAALAQRPLHRRTPSVGAAGHVGMTHMQSFPFVVVSPLCPPFKYWRVECLASLLKEVAERYNVDRRRIYAVGEGMGGWAVCALAARLPKRIAACVPICSATGPNFVDVDGLKKTPMWIFHGCSGNADALDGANVEDDDERAVDASGLNDNTKSDDGLRASLCLVHALRRQGARSVLFTTYPTTAAFSSSTKDNADSMPGVSALGSSEDDELVKRSYTYDNPLLYQWLLQHSLPLLDV